MFSFFNRNIQTRPVDVIALRDVWDDHANAVLSASKRDGEASVLSASLVERLFPDTSFDTRSNILAAANQLALAA